MAPPQNHGINQASQNSLGAAAANVNLDKGGAPD